MQAGAVIVLNGPVGVGKTVLGRMLAQRLGGAFLDSDALRDPAKSWVEEVLAVIDRLVAAGLPLLRRRRLLVIAKPLRARDWAVLRQRFAVRGASALCVTLAATPEAILAPGRGRTFSPAEAARVRAMVAQGYADRPFSDLVLRSDAAPLAETAEDLAEACRALLAARGFKAARAASRAAAGAPPAWPAPSAPRPAAGRGRTPPRRGGLGRFPAG